MVIKKILLHPFLSSFALTGLMLSQIPEAAYAYEWFAQAGGGLSLHTGLEDDRTLMDSSDINMSDRFKNWETENHSMSWLLSGGTEIPWPSSNPGYKIRLALSYNQTGELESKGVRADTGDIGSIGLNYSYKTSTKTAMAEVGLKVPVVESGEAYALFTLGLGYAWNKFSGFSSTPAEGSMSSLEIEDNEESQFAYSLGVFIGIPLYEQLGLEAGYRYVDAGKIKSGKDAFYSSPLVDDKLKLHLFEARLTLRF